ncbi:hypothetical protein Sa4125_08100 [Aureimonas sp. SA4125]|uniref:BA14K family protein n=1 Tax=Aureimonas sp. SA4125 TaxID=2826993 RepID=UPI001CC433C1|nr:BA14K family protein [Aureimonas sp. SA4125]BDA83268.1 hypothetical protein Sa4125_08100 [Aureimonas sp. SA4125]
MKKFFMRACALGLTASMALSSAVPASAAPFAAARATSAAPASTVSPGSAGIAVVPVQYRRGDRSDYRRGKIIRRSNARQIRRENRQVRRDQRRYDNRRDYYRGHRGYRSSRPGYRRHNGYWFPPAAFIAGAIIGGAASNRGVSNAHIRSCQSRYRSYRVSDNTYQPYNGPRQQCR